MPTERSNVTAVCDRNNLIVAGEEGQSEVILNTVELMNIASRQWFTATPLPEPLWCSSATVNEGQLYLLGGTDSEWKITQSVYTCSLTPTVCTRPTQLEVEFDFAWERIADLPVSNCTCIVLCGQLLAIGGCYQGDPVTAIHSYDSDTNSWKISSHMGRAR